MIWSRASSGCREPQPARHVVRALQTLFCLCSPVTKLCHVGAPVLNEQSTGPGSLDGVCHYTAGCNAASASAIIGDAIHGERCVARTQIPGESTRWIPLPRIAERQARTNHMTTLITGQFSSALLKADSAKRERHQVVRNALGILTLIPNIRTIVDGFGISADPREPNNLEFGTKLTQADKRGAENQI